MSDHQPRTNPSPRFLAVTPHITDPIGAGGEACRALYVGGNGNITVRGVDCSVDVLFVDVPVGVLPIAVTHVRAIGTSATNIVALF